MKIGLEHPYFLFLLGIPLLFLLGMVWRFFLRVERVPSLMVWRRKVKRGRIFFVFPVSWANGIRLLVLVGLVLSLTFPFMLVKEGSTTSRGTTSRGATSRRGGDIWTGPFKVAPLIQTKVIGVCASMDSSTSGLLDTGQPRGVAPTDFWTPGLLNSSTPHYGLWWALRILSRTRRKRPEVAPLEVVSLSASECFSEVDPTKMNFRSGEAPHPNPPPKRGREGTGNLKLLGITPRVDGYIYLSRLPPQKLPPGPVLVIQPPGPFVKKVPLMTSHPFISEAHSPEVVHLFEGLHPETLTFRTPYILDSRRLAEYFSPRMDCTSLIGVFYSHRLQSLLDYCSNGGTTSGGATSKGATSKGTTLKGATLNQTKLLVSSFSFEVLDRRTYETDWAISEAAFLPLFLARFFGISLEEVQPQEVQSQEVQHREESRSPEIEEPKTQRKLDSRLRGNDTGRERSPGVQKSKHLSLIPWLIPFLWIGFLGLWWMQIKSRVSP